MTRNTNIWIEAYKAVVHFGDLYLHKAKYLYTKPISFSSDLTWRDIQYLLAYTSNPDVLTGDDWVTNGGGLKVSHHFGFGAIDAEAMVTRAKHWTNVPEQHTQTFSSSSSSV